MSLTGLALTTLAKETLLPIAQAVLEEVAKSEHVVALENIQAAIEDNFPARIGLDVTGVDCAGGVK